MLQVWALGIRPGRSVVTETQTSKAIRQNLLEKVVALLPRDADRHMVWPALEAFLVFLE